MSEISGLEDFDATAIRFPLNAPTTFHGDYDFHDLILKQPTDHSGKMKTVSITANDNSERIQSAADIAPRGSRASGKAEIRFDWGGEDGPTVSGSASGSVSDNHGNTAEAKVEVNSDGTGSATASVSHEETDS